MRARTRPDAPRRAPVPGPPRGMGWRLVLVAALLAALTGCGVVLPIGEPRPVVSAPYQPVTAKGYPAGGLLVDADWVAARRDDPGVLLVDLSPWRRYQQGHLPGAVHLWWQDLMEVYNDTYGMLIGPEERAAVLGRLGIGPTTTVVAYDDAGGIWAARLVWALEFTGHERVHLLDGGVQAWLASGRALTTASRQPAPADYVTRLQPERIISYDELEPFLASGGALVDGRSAAEQQETWQGRLRDGRIPGALVRPWPENLSEPAGPFLPAEMLRARYAPVLTGRPVAVYGLFGARAAHDYVVLRALGVATVRLYDGSWAEWGSTARDDLPVAPLPAGP